MGSAPSPSGVDDTAARLIVTPLVGAFVPNLAGIIDNAAHTPTGLLASYLWFIAVAFLTWEGNLRLYLRFQDRTAWLTRPWHRVRLLVGLILLFTIPFTGLSLWGWAVVSGDPNATARSIVMAVITVVAAVTFITHVYETLFLVREWGGDRLRNERLERLNVEAELVALQSEVNPHTLFNNLNALSHLVEQGHPRAAAFVAALAGSYRYLLRSGSKRLVLLADELELLDQFLSLVTIRYADGLKVVVHVDAAAANRWCIPPVVLPELLENAVKHNEFTTDNPLQIEVRLEGDRLTVSHDRRPRPTPGGIKRRRIRELSSTVSLKYRPCSTLGRERRSVRRHASSCGGQRLEHCKIGSPCGAFCPQLVSPSHCCAHGRRLRSSAPTTCTTTSQNLWVREQLNQYYYWYQHLPANVNPATFNSPEAYLDAVRYRPLDTTYSYITSQAANDAFYSDSQFIGYGFGQQTTNTEIRVLQVYADSPALEAGLSRGDRITQVNGQSITSMVANGTIANAFGATEIGVASDIVFVTSSGEERRGAAW